ncbi:CrcB protein [Desulforamulus aeronauticus DSM 10349]|uniref:Fluoride-specific ion channel n=1 Tax=Desulforamulus aeronauticus DSM 10349 TaxID=1121421 RepID=A0A1M6NCA6_9FIRM|nr:CrcB protein [Desulforamulus aeronauticus DSM 10349]
MNLMGSFLLSFIAYGSSLKWNLPKKFILAINTGFIGSFTTFSTFSVDTLQLVNNGKYTLAISYVLISIIAGLTLSWLGVCLATKLYPNVAMKAEQ